MSNRAQLVGDLNVAATASVDGNDDFRMKFNRREWLRLINLLRSDIYHREHSEYSSQFDEEIKINRHLLTTLEGL